MKALPRFANQWRSIPTAAAIAVIALLAAGFLVIFLNERAYQQQTISETRTQAEILSASVTAALDFGDPVAAQDSVDALRANPEIRTAAVYDRRGRLFAGFARGDDQLAPTLGAAQREDGEVAAEAAVIRDSEAIGTVRLSMAREPVGRRLTRYALIGLFVIMATIVAAVLAAAQAALRRANRELELRAAALADANQELQVQMDERERAEEQLRQAQKMQALGQLTGGIAHDFNNLLTVIQGSAEILQRPGLPEEKRARFAAAIAQTAGRAATLTSQLLSFARRQPLRPKTIDLNEQIVTMVDLLDRTLGERVLVNTDLAPDLCLVVADPVQLESAVLNIAVNARDAMTEEGTLTVRTAMVDSEALGGRAVGLSISDTGKGMDAETMGRVFEPFFTTKGIGKGTGLGLSQVYGFATQSGGEVLVDSKEREGTTVTLVLPCSPESAKASAATGEARKADDPSLTGRVLVVDDNEDVGAFAEALLAELGFSVVRAVSGEEALAKFDAQRIDLVFTDVVMPGMSGLELAEELRARVADVPIILTTGYSDRLSDDESDYPVLLKPYRSDALMAAIGAALTKPSP